MRMVNYGISTVANANGAILSGFDRHAGHNSVMFPITEGRVEKRY